MSCARHPDVVLGLAACARCERRFCADCRLELLELTLCGACAREQLRDMQSGADALHLELAPIGRRMSALALDALLPLVFCCASAAVLEQLLARFTPWLREWDALAALLAAGLVGLGYEGALVAWTGRTLGKQASGIRVVSASLQPLRPTQAWARAAARFVLSAVPGVDYLPAFLTRERTCLHDLLARTRVVRARGRA